MEYDIIKLIIDLFNVEKLYNLKEIELTFCPEQHIIHNNGYVNNESELNKGSIG